MNKIIGKSRAEKMKEEEFERKIRKDEREKCEKEFEKRIEILKLDEFEKALDIREKKVRSDQTSRIIEKIEKFRIGRHENTLMVYDDDILITLPEWEELKKELIE